MALQFHTTSWSLIARAQADGDSARGATAEICQQYWHPLYAFARRTGQSAHEAEDTVQDFLVHFVEHAIVARADAERGRFRTFLLASFRQFLARRHRDQNRQKRSPGPLVVHADFERAERLLAAPGDGSPDHAFERAWAVTQLDLAWQRLEAEYQAGGKAELVKCLRPIISGASTTPIKELGQQLALSEGAVNVAAHRMRRRFGEILREQVALTLISPDEVDDEINRLRAALSQAVV